MRFYPERNSIEVKTYSPVTKQFLTNPKDQFELKCDFAERFRSHAAPASRPAASVGG
jgi:hypothetical protein